MQLKVNGRDVEVDDRHDSAPLLWVLRDVLGLPGTKFGCGGGFCSACTVLVDGKATRSCQTVANRTIGKAVTTVEGAAGPEVDAVRDAWWRRNVVQCGYCQPGQTLAACALLAANPAPDDAAIDRAMSLNLCRCGTYPRIRAAIHDAAATLRAGSAPEPLRVEPDIDLRPAPGTEDLVAPYLRITEDGTVVVFSSQSGRGPGARWW